MRKFLFLTLFLTALLGITSVWAQTTRYVPSEYPSIQAAVNASTAGDIVQIAAGTYSQNNYAWTDFVINKSISLIGAGSGQTIIQFTNKQHGLEIVTPASAVTIQGITFTKMDSNTQSAGWAIIAGETGGSFASLVFDDVEVSHASSRNIALLNATWQDIDMINCNIHHSFGWGMTVRGTITSITVTNSHFDYNGDLTNHPEYGIGFDIDMPQSVAALIINGGTFNHNTAKGVNLVKISSANIEGIDASYNGGAPGGGFGISLWEWAGASSNMNINDCNITGNALDGILFGSEGTTTIQNVLVSGGAISGNGRGGIFCYGMNSSTLTGLMVTGVDLSGNSVGIWSNYPAEIVASPNWWGDLDPSDDVSGNVSYDPWYDSSAMDHLMSNAPVQNVTRNLFYYSIQPAIDASIAGEIITVAAGTYTENLSVYKSVTIQGPETGSPAIVDGGGNGTVITITADGTTIKYLTVTNSGTTAQDCGIAMFNVADCVIDHNTLYGNVASIGAAGGSNNQITYNTVHSSYYGIALENTTGTPEGTGANGFSIAHNTIDNIVGIAIWTAQNCNSNVVEYNTIGNGAGSTIGTSGIYIWKGSDNLVTNNTVKNSGIGVELMGTPRTQVGYNNISSNTNGIVVRTGFYGSLTPASSNILIEHNTVSNNTQFGIKMTGGIDPSSNGPTTENSFHSIVDCTIQDNIVSGGNFGIVNAVSDRSLIQNNSVTGYGQYGISVIYGQDNTLQGNTVNSSVPGSLDAIAVANSGDLALEFNQTYGTKYGSTNNVIVGNTISSLRDGIFFGENCGPNTVGGSLVADGNTITAASIGISIWRPGGFTISNNSITSALTGIRLLGSSDNTITYNNVTGNGVGIKADRSWQDGVWYPCANNTLQFNKITGNSSYGVRADDNESTFVNATRNWWGDVNGPNPPELRFGNSVSSYVNYIPWWQDEAMTILGYPGVRNVNRDTYFYTIQGAIDDPETETGDVIVVAAETFNVMTPIVVNKSVTISGTINRDGRTLIQGTDPANVCVLEIAASGVTVENLEITHTSIPSFFTPYNELQNSLVRIPANAALTDVVFTNNIVWVPQQAGAMSTWNCGGFTVGSAGTASPVTVSLNLVYNTRNGMVFQGDVYASIISNVIYNTKGGIMNYTNSLDDAANRTMTSNSWGTAHNEWDIVWNTAYFVPDYQVSVLGLSNANNGAYVLDRRAADAAACGVLTGNRSHIWVDDDSAIMAPHPAKGNINEPFNNLQLGLAAVVPGGTVYLADGTYVETGQIAVNKDVNIIGEDEATTIIKPAQDTAGSGDAQAFMLVGEGFEMNLSNVTIDCGGKLVRNAIRTKGSGTIYNVTIQNVYYSTYNGWGIAYDWSAAGQDWTITNCTFQNIERVCILVDGQTNLATISVCDFIGLGAGDDVNYGVEIGDGAHADIGPDNSFSNFLGVASTDGSESGGVMMTSYFGPNPTAAVTGNTFTNNSYGIMIGYLINDSSFMTISNNTFTNNSVQVTAVSNTVVDLNATWANNTYDHKFLYDYTIYGSGSLLYVDAPEELIKDNELQVYSVKSTYVENLRGFSIQIKIPVADFNQPDHEDPGNDFAIGAAYTAHSYQPAFLQPVVYYGIIDGYYTYKVDGAYYSGGPDSGITGENKELFTVSLTSLVDRDNISVPGCLITIPLDEVVLYDANNPPVEIACVATEPMLVLIDASEPTMLHNTAGTYPTMYLLSVIPDGSGLLDRPTLNFTFTDNYNLQNVQYLIQAEGLGAPTLDTQFPADYILQNSLLATTTLDWQLPVEVDALADGTYTIYYLVLDDAGNYTIYNWDFIIDTTAPDPVTWWPEPTAVNQPAPCRTSVNGNNSIDLKWTNGDGTAKVDIWRYCFGDAATYPEYDVPGFALPAAPNPYHASPDNGWVRVADDVVLQEHTDTGMPRGYYYYTLFAQDASGNLSTAPAAPFHRESISYWPGDVDANPGTVQSGDISMLSAKWGKTSTSEGWSNIIDVGPTVDRARRSRPTPDNVINIEDMMIFAMNYYNTNYTQYVRQDEESAPPVTIAMNVVETPAQIRVTLDLAENGEGLTGVSIPVGYGSGLLLQSVEQGNIWPESSLLLHTNEEGVVEVSGAVLGTEAIPAANGSIAELVFAIVGTDTSLELMRMTARDHLNRDIEIANNPGAYTDNEDLINIIPAESYLAQNFPNPFNPTTTVRFGLKEAGKVQLSVYNNRGQLVRTLVNDHKAAGTYQIVWDGKDRNGRSASSGLYLIRLETPGLVQTCKALMIK